MDENDFSLPYEVALANFRKKYGNTARFWSKEEYELMQAREEAQKKREAAREAGTAEGAWAYQKGPSDEIVENITGKVDPTHEEVKDVANEIIERRITPDQQGIQSKGNPGDNLNNPDALDTSEVTKLHNELKSMAQTEDNMEPGTWSNTPEQVEEAKNKAGITKEVPGSTSASSDDGSDDDSDDGDSDGDSGPDKNYKKSMMSIWDAYRNGLIDKETAGYFTIDAIATLAKNLGRSIGNVGAQFSGGTIDNGHDESKWGQRQKAVMAEETQKELEGIGSTASRKAESERLDNEAKKIRNAYTPKQLDQQIEMFKKDLEMAGINISKAKNTQDIIDYIKEDPNYVDSPFKMAMVAYLSQTGVGGAAKSGADALNWLLTVFK